MKTKNNDNNKEIKGRRTNITTHGFNRGSKLLDTVFSANPSNPINHSSALTNKMNKVAALGARQLTTTTDIYTVTPGYAKQMLIAKPNTKIEYAASYSKDSIAHISPVIDEMFKANSKLYKWANFTSPAAGRLSAPSIELITGSHDLVGRIVLDTASNTYKPSPKMKLILEIAKKIVNAYIKTPLTNNKLDQYSCNEFFGLSSNQTVKFITDTGYTANMLAIASLLIYFIVYVGEINLIFYRFQTYIRIAQVLPTINDEYWERFQYVIRDTSNKDRNVTINAILKTINYGYLDAEYWLNELIAVNQCGKPTNDGTTEFRIADITLNKPTIKVLFAGQNVLLPTIPVLNELDGNWQTTIWNLIYLGQPVEELHQKLENFTAQCRSIKTFINFLAPILDTIDVPKFSGSIFMNFIKLDYFRTMDKILPLPANNFWSSSLASLSWLPALTPAYNWNSELRILQLLIPGVKTQGWSDSQMTREYLKTALSFKFDNLSEKVRAEIEPYARISAIKYCVFWFNEKPISPNESTQQGAWIDPSSWLFCYNNDFTQWISLQQLMNFLMNRYMYTRFKYRTQLSSKDEGAFDMTSALTAACTAVYTQDISNYDYSAYAENYFGNDMLETASFSNKAQS